MGVIKVPVGKLKEGMVIGQDIHIPESVLKEGRKVGSDDKGKNPMQSLVLAGIILDKKLIDHLRLHLEYIYVDTKSIKVSADETVVTEEVKGNILVTGRLRINAKINPKVKIKAANKVVIETNVPEGCIIESETADVMVHGELIGTSDAPIVITCSKLVAAKGMTFCRVSSGNAVRVSNDCIDSIINAKEEITIGGSVIRCELTSQSCIKANNCGGGLSKLVVKTEIYEGLCSTLSAALGLSQPLLDDIKKFSGDIETAKAKIRAAANSGEKIPFDKKKALLDGLTSAEEKYKSTKDRYGAHQAKISELVSQLTNQLIKSRIIVSDILYPPVDITIENTTNHCKNEMHGVTFYIHETDKRLKCKTSTHL